MPDSPPIDLLRLEAVSKLGKPLLLENKMNSRFWTILNPYLGSFSGVVLMICIFLFPALRRIEFILAVIALLGFGLSAAIVARKRTY